MSKATPAARRKARHYAVQALYQWQMAGADLISIETEFRTDNDMSKVDLEYFNDVLHGIPREKSNIDEKVTPLLDRRLDEMRSEEHTSELQSRPHLVCRLLLEKKKKKKEK